MNQAALRRQDLRHAVCRALRFAGLTATVLSTTVLAVSPALASNALDSPENGVTQVGRGSAWLARADDPTAAYYNPAAMVRNPSGVHLGAHLLFRSFCFERKDVNGQPVAPKQGFNPPPGETCADNPPFPNPQIAVSWHLAKRWAIGLSIAGPHTNGGIEWPDVIKYDTPFAPQLDHPAPNRYLLLDNAPLAVFPTISAGFAITKQLSIGAGFVWGLVSIEVSQMNESTSPTRDNPDDFSGDIKAKLTGFDAFVPGFVVSALWSPSRRFDIAGWYRFSDQVNTKIDLFAQSNYYADSGQVNETAINNPANQTDIKEAGTFKLKIPMEARLGFRYHHPCRNCAASQKWVTKHGGWVRDPMVQDLFDVEVDITWAHNSAVENIEIEFQPGINLNGTLDGAQIPTNGNNPRNWKDVLGVRLGGEYVIIPDFLAVRAGAFFETKGVDDEYLNLDFHQGFRVGGSGGFTVRAHKFDLSFAYQHTSFGTLDNGGQGLVKTVSGDATTGDFRSRQTVNGGKATSSLDEIALGATFHY